MSTHKQRIGLATMVLGLLAFSVTAQAQLPSQTIYKWTDENGVVHYEMRKPSDENVPVEVIKKRLTEPAGTPAADSGDAATSTPATQPADTAAATTESETSKPKKDPKICELARSNLEQLKSRRFVSIVDEYGNERILDEKEVAAQIKRAQDAVKANCN